MVGEVASLSSIFAILFLRHVGFLVWFCLALCENVIDSSQLRLSFHYPLTLPNAPPSYLLTAPTSFGTHKLPVLTLPPNPIDQPHFLQLQFTHQLLPKPLCLSTTA